CDRSVARSGAGSYRTADCPNTSRNPLGSSEATVTVSAIGGGTGSTITGGQQGGATTWQTTPFVRAWQHVAVDWGPSDRPRAPSDARQHEHEPFDSRVPPRCRQHPLKYC